MRSNSHILQDYIAVHGPQSTLNKWSQYVILALYPGQYAIDDMKEILALLTEANPDNDINPP